MLNTERFTKSSDLIFIVISSMEASSYSGVPGATGEKSFFFLSSVSKINSNFGAKCIHVLLKLLWDQENHVDNV